MRASRHPSRRVLAATILVSLLLAGCAGGSSLAAGADRSLIILYTNDMHAHLLPAADGTGGVARIAGYVESVRQHRSDVLFLDAGDAVAGGPVSSIFEGKPIFEIMNEMGYDAMELGNHEFDYGYRMIADYRRIAAFPILCGNAFGPHGKLLADAADHVFTVQGVRVGVIGVITPSTPYVTMGGMTDGCTFTSPEKTVAKLLPQLERKCDLVVVLSHLGLDDDERLAKEVPGIDVIVGGHSHSDLEKPVRVGGTIIVQAYCYAKRVGRLDLVIGPNGAIARYKDELVKVDDRLPVGAGVANTVAAWEKRVSKRVDVAIGAVPHRMSEEELRGRVEAIFRDTLKADLGYQNPGGVRSTLDKGKLTIREVWELLPFDNTLVRVRVLGSKLPSWARSALKKVDPRRVYTVATSSYVVSHRKRYFPNGVEGTVDTGIGVRDAVVHYVKKHGTL